MGLDETPGRTLKVDPSGHNPTTFAGGTEGVWQVDRMQAIIGPRLRAVSPAAVLEGKAGARAGRATWRLTGVTREECYANRAEHDTLAARQLPLGRPEAVRAALRRDEAGTRAGSQRKILATVLGTGSTTRSSGGRG
jgi:hypothetical protein